MRQRPANHGPARGARVRTRASLMRNMHSAQVVFAGRELDNARALSSYGLAAGGEYPMTLVLKTKGM